VKSRSTRRVPWILLRTNEQSSWTYLGIKIKKAFITRAELADTAHLYIPEDNSPKNGLIITTYADSSHLPEVSIRSKDLVTFELETQSNEGSSDEVVLSDEIERNAAAVDDRTAEELGKIAAGAIKLTFRISDPTFVLIKKTGEPNKEVLYIGTDGYVDKKDHKWPESNEWQQVKTPDGEDISFFSPSDAGPELRIQTNTASFLSPIRLLENTKYSWAMLSGTPGLPLSDSKSPDESACLTWGSTGQSLESEGKSLGTFNFKNFLGTAIIKSAGSSLVQVESTSLKLGYEDEYLRMLKDLTEEALDHILNYSSITSAHLKAGSHANKNNAFGRYILLKAALPLDRLKSSCAIIRSKPHTTLSSSYKWTPASAANGRYAMQAPISRVRWATNHDSSPGQRQFRPAEVLEESRLESTDTPPNEFAKFALHEFAQACELIYKNPSRYGENYATEAKSYAEECRRQLRVSPFGDAKNMRSIPFDNQVLQKRSGYREVFRGWITSNLGLSIKELASQGLLSPEAENRDAPKLYELWLISHLKRAIGTLTEDISIVHESKPYDSGEQIELYASTKEKPVGSKPIYVARTSTGLLIGLYYNRTFNGRKTEGAPRPPSYSVELRPDYTVEIIKTKDGGLSVNSQDTYMATRNQPEHKPEKGGATSYIHFDAKFRINNVRDLSEDDPTKAKPADIYKMHTYNEAIYGTVTSIILYPGKAPNEKKGEEDAQYKKFTDLVPGVSALAVRPDKDATGNACSERAIDTLKVRLLKIIKLIDSEVEDAHTEESKGHGDYLRMRDAETIALQARKPNGKTFKYRRPPTSPVDNI
jgi:predicted component of viral defense system (DUF524 family)